MKNLSAPPYSDVEHNGLTDAQIIEIASKYCDFTIEGTYHLRRYSGWAITSVVRECMELSDKSRIT